MWKHPYVVGLIAAVVIGVGAGLVAWLLDSGNPYVLIGILFAVIAFLAGAGGRARYRGNHVPDETRPSRFV